ncbi:hypothetical protein EG327_001849 [Venturia inaequalis]|uniref:BED-type domain-containing protein n=1 Tax=Venturia inaequalis TaxID=5025 RepID=A0A8H3VJ68_VENIN|nr:hypothetical protein EG327_001849 [Venturia inaequalis]
MPPKGSRPNFIGKDPIWSEVTTSSSGKTNPLVICNHCQKEWTSSAPTRIRQHLTTCTSLPEQLWDEFQPQLRYPDLQLLDPQSLPLPPGVRPVVPGPPRKRKAAKLDVEFDAPENEMESLDRECAEWIFGTGLPLATVDHPLFKKFMRRLRPDYDSPPGWRLGEVMASGASGGIAGSLADILRNQESAFEEGAP